MKNKMTIALTGMASLLAAAANAKPKVCCPSVPETSSLALTLVGGAILVVMLLVSRRRSAMLS